MSPRLSVALLLTALLAAPGAAEPPRIEAATDHEAVPWTGLDARDAPDDFRFVVITDRTGEHREGVFAGAIPKVNLVEPAFVLSVGDLIEGYTDDRELLAQQWEEFSGFVKGLRAPFFYAPGNHDISNATMAEVWRQRFGPSYYDFRYKRVHFVVLNSELFSSVSVPGEPVGGPDTQPEQMAWLERVLGESRGDRWTFVVVHQPLWDRPQVPEDWLRVERLLGRRPHTVLAGHLHRYTRHRRNDRDYVTLSTTGGGNPLRGIDRGEFDHVALVTMTAAGPVFANLMLDGIHGVDVRTEAVREAVRRLEGAIVPERLLIPDGAFRDGVARFAVRNEGDAPLELHARFEPGRSLSAVPSELRHSVAPGATETLEVPVRAGPPVPAETAAPAVAHFALRTRGPDGRELEVEEEAWIQPDRDFTCGPGGEIVVDGNLADWPDLHFAAEARPARGSENGGGAPGASFRFGVRCTVEGVIVGVAVRDATPFFDSGRVARKQDGISFVLDARPDPARSANEGFWQAVRGGSLREMILVFAAPVQPREDPVFRLFLPPPPEGVRTASRRTPQGYTTEIAIPGALLDERQGQSWDAFRLELGVRDFDTNGRERASTWWRPSRFGFSALPVPGSGTFVRAPSATP